jgi:hypothetical protein
VVFAVIELFTGGLGGIAMIELVISGQCVVHDPFAGAVPQELILKDVTRGAGDAATKTTMAQSQTRIDRAMLKTRMNVCFKRAC